MEHVIRYIIVLLPYSWKTLQTTAGQLTCCCCPSPSNASHQFASLSYISPVITQIYILLYFCLQLRVVSTGYELGLSICTSLLFSKLQIATIQICICTCRPYNVQICISECRNFFECPLTNLPTFHLTCLSSCPLTILPPSSLTNPPPALLPVYPYLSNNLLCYQCPSMFSYHATNLLSCQPAT